MAACGAAPISSGLHEREDQDDDGKRDDVSQDAQQAIRHGDRKEKSDFDEGGRRALHPDNECSQRVGRTGATRSKRMVAGPNRNACGMAAAGSPSSRGVGRLVGSPSGLALDEEARDRLVAIEVVEQVVDERGRRS